VKWAVTHGSTQDYRIPFLLPSGEETPLEMSHVTMLKNFATTYPLHIARGMPVDHMEQIVKLIMPGLPQKLTGEILEEKNISILNVVNNLPSRDRKQSVYSSRGGIIRLTQRDNRKTFHIKLDIHNALIGKVAPIDFEGDIPDDEQEFLT